MEKRIFNPETLQKKKRHQDTIKKNLPVIWKALCTGGLFSFIQYLINYFNLSFPKEAENSILFIIIVFSFFAYVIVAGYAIIKVLDESKEFSFAILMYDQDKFLLLRDERLPYLMYLPMGASALVFTFAILFFPYPGRLIGITTIFSVVFLLMIFYLIIIEIDHYEHSSWFRENTPDEWWTMDAQKYFKEKK